MGTMPLTEAPGISEAAAAGAALVGNEPSANLAEGATLETARPEVFTVACADCGIGDLWRRSVG